MKNKDLNFQINGEIFNLRLQLYSQSLNKNEKLEIYQKIYQKSLTLQDYQKKNEEDAKIIFELLIEQKNYEDKSVGDEKMQDFFVLEHGSNEFKALNEATSPRASSIFILQIFKNLQQY